MRHPVTVKDSNLTSASDLIVLAPIRDGFVPALDAVTYRSRVERVLTTLHTGRSLGHEFDLSRMLSDAVERVGRIHSVRIAVLEPAGDVPHVMLAVTFDGSWESYVRTIWQKVGRLLDLIFCNTEDYTVAWTSSFEAWGAWLRHRQAKSAFLYSTPEFTHDDVQYLRIHERQSRHVPGSDVQHNGLSVPTAEAIAYSWYASGTNPANLGLDQPLKSLVESGPAVFRQGLRALAGLYRLADVYPPSTTDGKLLHAAAVELLPDFARMMPGAAGYLARAWSRAQERFADPLNWLCDASQSLPARPAPPSLPALPDCGNRAELQAGLLEPFDGTDHGVLLLLAFEGPQALADFLTNLPATTAASQPQLLDGDVTLNLALTLDGLRLAGLTDEEVDQLPAEFAQGMARRAGLLGDLRGNHPQRWRLPVLNWAAGVNAGEVQDESTAARTPLSAVHALVQARLVSRLEPTSPVVGDAQARQQILAVLTPLVTATGVRPLSLQWMARQRDAQDSTRVVDHFRFNDAKSDPVLTKAAAGRRYKNQVHAGELLIGGATASEPAPPPPGDDAPWVVRLLHRGSFLVVRKLRQDAARLERVTQDAGALAGLTADEVAAKLVGRCRDGKTPITLPHGALNDNDFDYGGNDAGAQCPVHAHVRRANPRTVFLQTLASQLSDGARPPRLFRRGMSYGPRYQYDAADAATREASAAEPRGLVFMAYNASIGEQFETVQHWLSSGNSAGGYSGQPDPLVGQPEPGLPRIYRFEHAGTTVRVELDGDRDALAEPRPLVRLEWGGYFLTPTLPALAQLATRAQERAARDRLPWSADKGRELIERLRAIQQDAGADAARDAWKEQLEDITAAQELRSADLWAAIRRDHGGLLQTPYGLLVASPALVQEVLDNRNGDLTSTAYLPRMRRSFGEIYLGMDNDPVTGRYALESAACNDAIMQRDRVLTRQQARDAVLAHIDRWVREARANAQEDEYLRRNAGRTPRDMLAWDLTIEIRELVEHLLGEFCESWFGMREDTGHFQRAGLRWTWTAGEPPCYPGHFMAPSRYIFQPHPGPRVEEVGAEHGQAMLAAMQDFLRQHGAGIAAPIAKAVLSSPPSVHDLGLAARNLVGAMMGMVPTVDANLRRVMAIWLDDGVLWSLRSGGAGAGEIDRAFVRAMQERAAPDTLWRTAVRGFTLGTGAHQVQVRSGEQVVAGLVSATNAHRETGQPDVTPAYGGDRTQAAGHPTHACPGYMPSMAMMLGFADALVQTAWHMRAGPGPGTLVIDGREAYEPPWPVDGQPLAKAAQPVALRTMTWGMPQFKFAPLAAKVPLWAFGDSWLYRDIDVFPELVTELPQFGYQVTNAFAETGQRLQQMANTVADVAQELAQSGDRAPRAILLGGGGNDIVHPLNKPGDSPLFRMLNPQALDPQQALVPLAVANFVGGDLARWYRVVLDELLDATAAPIFIHGYDYPTPDGRCSRVRVFGKPVGPCLAGPWLQPVFVKRVMHNLPFNRDVMRLLIQELNAMIVGLTLEPAYAGRVHHLQLNGVLSTEHWDNELHPLQEGYRLLAQDIARQLGAAGVL